LLELNKIKSPSLLTLGLNNGYLTREGIDMTYNITKPSTNQPKTKGRPLCRFHHIPLDELWPNELICETCLEAELMTPEEDEAREDNTYYNSIQDSE